MPLFDKKDKSRYATFTRRSVGLGGGMAAVFAVLGGRLYQLQIKNGDQYLVDAEANRISERLIAPPRGRIIDRFGVELATSRRNYRVLLVSEQATEGVEEALDQIAKVIYLPDQQKRKVIHDIAMNKKFVPVPVVENLSWDDFSRVNLHLPYLPGVQCDVGETRDYPFGPELVHVLGYVASVSEQELAQDDDPLMSLPGMRIGKRGIEKQFDREIRGRAGASRVEVNAYGRIIRELGNDPGEPGEDVYLTIDRQVQQLADQKLGTESAAMVVMDVNNGDVIALSSTPGFDPNWFNVGLSGTQWNGLTTDDHKPLLNKVTSGIYPPGSTFKTAVALAAVPNFTLGSATLHLATNDYANAAAVTALADFGSGFDANGHTITLTQDALSLTPTEYAAVQSDNIVLNGHALSALATGIGVTSGGGTVHVSGNGVDGATLNVYASSGASLSQTAGVSAAFTADAAEGSIGNGVVVTETVGASAATSESAPIIALEQTVLTDAATADSATFAGSGSVQVGVGQYVNLYTTATAPASPANPVLVYDATAHTLSLDITGHAPLVLVTLGSATHPASLDPSEIVVKHFT